MNAQAYWNLAEFAARPNSILRSVDYLAGRLEMFLKPREQVMICFPNEPGTIGSIMEQAVLRCGAIPFFMGEDIRWLTILRTAFSTKCDCIIGPPLLLLGLAKVASHMCTPLYARNVVVAGYPSMDWMIEGVQKGLDCRVWGCFDPGIGAVVGGFSCGCSRGVHLRTEEYGVEIVDTNGESVPEGTIGNVILYPAKQPEIRFNTGDRGRLDNSLCKCGCNAPRLMDIDMEKGTDDSHSRLGEELHLWSSILDCRLANTGYGLELELVVFPGEKLPKLPSCAKLVIRPWHPETDKPFPHQYVLKSRYLADNNH